MGVYLPISTLYNQITNAIICPQQKWESSPLSLILSILNLLLAIGNVPVLVPVLISFDKWEKIQSRVLCHKESVLTHNWKL